MVEEVLIGFGVLWSWVLSSVPSAEGQESAFECLPILARFWGIVGVDFRLRKSLIHYVGRGLGVGKALLDRRALKPRRIIEFNFEVTRRCNGRCRYCNIWRNPSRIEDELSPMEIEEFLKPRELFRDVEAVGVTGGEAILRGDIVDVVGALCKACPKASIGVVSNGLMPERLLEVAQRIWSKYWVRINVGLSLDGFNDSDNLLRGDEKHFGLVLRAATLLRENEFHVGFGSTLTPVNIGEIVRLREFLGEKGFSHSYVVAAESNHYYANAGLKLGLSGRYVEDLQRLNAGNKGLTSFQYFLPSYIKRPRQMFPCFSGFSSFFLAHNGDVYPCIHNEGKLGNLRKESFRDLWFGNKARQVRRGIVDNRCHCWTSCEAGSTIRTLLYPALMKRLRL